MSYLYAGYNEAKKNRKCLLHRIISSQQISILYIFSRLSEGVRKVVFVILNEAKDLGGGSYLALPTPPLRDSSVVLLLQNDIFGQPLQRKPED